MVFLLEDVAVAVGDFGDHGLAVALGGDPFHVSDELCGGAVEDGVAG